MRGYPQKVLILAWRERRSSKNAVFRGTIRREVKGKYMTPQRPDVGDPHRFSKLSPDWIVGFIDGEGCFYVGINKHSDLRTGYQILPELTVVQHERDIDLLYALRSVFNCGVVRRNHDDRYCWRVRDIKNLISVVLPFFEKYRLKSKKAVDFNKFRDVVRIMERQEHLTAEGVQKIIAIAESMNRMRPREPKGPRESPL
jgi:hypothetical protein